MTRPSDGADFHHVVLVTVGYIRGNRNQTSGGTLRSCAHCSLAQFNLGLDSLSHLCRCACVQDFYDFERFEQQRFNGDHFTKHRMAIPSTMPLAMRSR